jgi:hypothetical protein
MAKTVTLAQLRASARLQADFVNSQYFSDSDVNNLLNSSIGELYDLAVQSDEDYYRTISTINMVSGTDTYALPADFYKLKKVRAYVGSSPTVYEEIERFNDNERVYYSTSASNLPTLTIDFEYIPSYTTLASDSDTLDGINGFEELVVIDTCIKMKDREESDVSVLMGRKQMMMKRIEEMISMRDMNKPERITDVHKQYSRFAPGNPGQFLRYRIIGGNIVFVTYVPPWA